VEYRQKKGGKIEHLQGASRETDVFEIDVTEQVEGVEAWVRGN
jgi:hypothetical protein